MAPMGQPPLGDGVMRASWRSGERREEIRVGPDCVEVIPAAGCPPVFRAHPYWVRLVIENEDGRLKPAGYVAVNFGTQGMAEGLSVPSEAV
ncbi:MAG: DUF2244 domain-containing protein, partial [Delftia acidovorans]|nr:DUF2244 domain-containing protein [Delftia acidovorans]